VPRGKEPAFSFPLSYFRQAAAGNLSPAAGARGKRSEREKERERERERERGRIGGSRVHHSCGRSSLNRNIKLSAVMNNAYSASEVSHTSAPTRRSGP